MTYGAGGCETAVREYLNPKVQYFMIEILDCCYFLKKIFSRIFHNLALPFIKNHYTRSDFWVPRINQKIG